MAAGVGMLSPGGLSREQAVELLSGGACWCGRELGIHEVPCPEVPFPVAMLMYPHLRQSTLSDFWQCHLLSRFKIVEDGWHSQPQARGSHFHRWAAELLRHLETIGRDKLRDEPECDNPACGARPNELGIEGPEPGSYLEFVEGQVCPVCGEGVLHGRALEDVAVELLIEVLRQRDVPYEERLPLPYGKHLKDLEWIVRKFAKEQTFNITRLVDVEHRYRAPLYYKNPFGGMVERIFSGQMDAVFLGADEHHLVVLDWKDTWAIPGPQSISEEGYFQQRAYAYLLMMEHEHIDKVTLKEVYVRFSAGESGDDNHRTATITRDRLPMIHDELALFAEMYDEAVQDGEEHPELWEDPSPGGVCNFCPTPHACPVWSDLEHMRASGPISTPEEAEAAAGLMIVAKRVAKLMEGRVKGWVAKPGPRPTVRAIRETGVTKGDAKEQDALTVFKDHRPGLPPGVPVRNAKGRKVFAYVEGTRTEKPDEEQIQQALDAVARGIPVTAKDLIKTGASTTFRLVEEAVAVDSDVDARLASVVSEEQGDG